MQPVARIFKNHSAKSVRFAEGVTKRGLWEKRAFAALGCWTHQFEVAGVEHHVPLVNGAMNLISGALWVSH